MITDRVLQHAPLVLEQRTLTSSDEQFDLAPDHTVAKPNIRRLRKAVDQHPDLWTFAQDPSVYLDDTGPAQGPLTALPGTHRGTIFEQFDDDGRWTGAVAERDVATLRTDTAVDLCGPAGTVVALPMTPLPAPTSRTGLLVRGQEPVGYRSIFAAQTTAARPAWVD